MNEQTVKNYLFLANGDLKTAEDELNMQNPVTNTVCFHAQQCIEKYLKAFLTLIGQPFGKTHDIAELIELSKKFDTDFDQLYHLKANKLTRYAVEVRYPDEFYIPSLQEAKESIDIAKNVKQFVLEKLKSQGFKL